MTIRRFLLNVIFASLGAALALGISLKGCELQSAADNSWPSKQAAQR